MNSKEISTRCTLLLSHIEKLLLFTRADLAIMSCRVKGAAWRKYSSSDSYTHRTAAAFDPWMHLTMGHLPIQ